MREFPEVIRVVALLLLLGACLLAILIGLQKSNARVRKNKEALKKGYHNAST